MGISIIPFIVVALFFMLEALPQLFYCTVKHNIMIGMIKHRLRFNLLFSFSALLILTWSIRKLISNPYVKITDKKVIFMILVGGVYGSLLKLYPVVEKETEISLFPLLIILVVGISFKIVDNCKCKVKKITLNTFTLRRANNPLPLLMIPLILLPMFRTASELEKWSKSAYMSSEKNKKELITPRTYKYLLEDIFKITTSSDYVMDLKGQSIYRQRPFYYALELFTKKRLRLGLIEDSIIEKCLDTKTKVVVLSRYYPARDYEFFQQQYVEIDQRVPSLRVVGHFIGCRNPTRTQTFPINVVIPARYAIVAEKGKVTGLLDGKPYNGPRFLAAGHHLFKARGGQGWLVLVWARALERGFKPIVRTGVCNV